MGGLGKKTKVPDPRDEVIKSLENKLEIFYRKKRIDDGIDPGKLEVIVLEFHIKSLEERLKQPGWIEGERKFMERKIEVMKKQLYGREEYKNLEESEKR